MQRMLSMRDLKLQTLQGLSQEAVTALAAQMLGHIEKQARDLEAQHKLLQRKDRDIAYRDAKIEKITFELARLKRWKFGAKSEAMTADQRQMFQDTLLEDEADLEAQLAALQAALPKMQAKPKVPARRPRRQALPEHLRRVEHHHEPEDTTCATADCGQPMTRIGEDVSERLDIVPAEFLRSTGTSTASGRAAAASAKDSSAWCRSRPIRRSSTAASPPAGWWRTR